MRMLFRKLIEKINFRYYLFIALSLTKLRIAVCQGGSECPNEPVTPYSIPKPTADCTKQQIPAYSITTQSPPFVSCPTIPTETGCCLKQQINPCPLTTSNKPCPVVQTYPPGNYICINHNGYTCLTNLSFQCCSPPSNCQFCGSTTASSGSTIPHCALTTSNCGSTNNCCQIGHPNETTPSPTYEPRPTPPETLIKCPSGTQLIKKECHLIHCPRGSQMVNDRCVVIKCPEGTIWTGHRCSIPEPIVQNVTFYNTVITQFNQTKPDIILNNTNNIVVNASLTKHDEGILTRTTKQPSKLECCIVMTPRMCAHHNNRWQCFSRRSRRCGEFCIAPIIYLKISRVHTRPQYVVMPPIQNDCQSYGNCGPVGGVYDCSGCATKYMDRCSYYCYRYSCASRRCAFYDQEKYCAHNADSYGCQEEDGCFDDWCL